jgi:putative MFS transporter
MVLVRYSCIYAGILFGPSKIAPAVGIKNGAVFNLLIEFLFIVPGGIVAILSIDRMGRKPLQTVGFLGMFASLMLFSSTGSSLPAIGAFVLYGLMNFFQQAGPLSITGSGMLGVELAPTKVRGVVQSTTVAAGRTGAFLTTFLFPYLPLNVAIGILSIVALIAAVLTYFGIPETKGKPLEESSSEVEVEEKS